LSREDNQGDIIENKNILLPVLPGGRALKILNEKGGSNGY
jgi:hypothetical protein